MVFRNDITVDWTQSPRLIFIGAPSTIISIQDLIDTLRVLEEKPYQGLSYPSIIEAAGKENLGGGVTVGITAKLINARVAFESRKNSIESGTITTSDTNGVTINDSTALFITNQIEPGSWVINLNDGSRATVLRVTSETQIITDGLGDGIDNQFNFGDLYEIQNVIQCEVNGGNLVAVAADGITPISAILPTMGTQAVRTSSSSATLQELSDIQYSSFNGGVTINLLSSYSGTVYPNGTPRQPVNNFTDGLSIANTRGFDSFFIKGNAIIDSGLNYNSKIFYGESETKSILTVDTNAQVTNCEFYEATVQGTLDGGSHLISCVIRNLDYVNGYVQKCILSGEIILSGDGYFLDCWSGIPGASTPVVNFNNINSSLAIRNYNGGITLKNKNGDKTVSIDLNSGQIILDSTVTSGLIIIRGVGKLTDNSVGATVDATHLLNPNNIMNAILDEPKTNHTIPGTIGNDIATKKDVISTIIAFK